MKKKIVASILALLCASTAATGWAYNVSFADNQNYWPTWGNSDYDGQLGKPDNQLDVIGNPKIDGGRVVIGADGRLQRITFDYHVNPVNDWSMLGPGNLFINILNNPNDTVWDYVVNTIAPLGKNVGSAGLAGGRFDLYNVSIDARKGQNDTKYLLSGTDNSVYTQPANNTITTDWRGYLIRDLHPIAVDFSNQANYISKTDRAVGFTGFPGTDVDNQSTNSSIASASYDFLSYFGGLDLRGKDFIIGWEMTCANDVIYEKIHNPVPEPSTVILLGAGLAGLGLLRRRSRK